MSVSNTGSRPRNRKSEDLTDWERVRNMTEEEIEANAASDPDNPPWADEDFARARLVEGDAAAKPVIWVHVDPDIVEWFRTRKAADRLVNDLLREVMDKERETT